MLKNKPIISFDRFEILLRIYRIELSFTDKIKVYTQFKEIFKYDTFFTYIDEDTEMLKYNLNCRYVIEQLIIEMGIK